MPQYTPQVTLQYSLFIKRAIIESLQAAFTGHPDPTVATAKVAMDFTSTRFKLPAVIVKFFEREMPNAGVGHVEYLTAPQDPNPADPTTFVKYTHRLYKGDIEFEIFGESAVDRDVVRDALIEVVAMGDVTPQGTSFLDRFYTTAANTPYGQWHYPTLNTDLITGYGEQSMLAPWSPEDKLIYQVSYRVPIFGEFYSKTPVSPSAAGLVEEVDVYPYVIGLDPLPADAPSSAYYKFTGWSNTQTII